MKNTATISSTLCTKTTSELQALTVLAAICSKLLEEEITPRKLRHLLHVQTSGFMLFLFAAWNVGALMLGLAWFATALYSAKQAWKTAKTEA